MWQKDEKYWNRQAPVLFPIVGKLKEFSYNFLDNEYQMSQHGFARDMRFEMIDQQQDYITFCLKSNAATRKIYPFDFELLITYLLVGKRLITKYKIRNLSNYENMYFSIGAHPAFNWPIGDFKQEDFLIDFNTASKSLKSLRLKNGLITNDEIDVSLNNGELKLNTNLFKNDALIFENLKNREIAFKSVDESIYLKIGFDDFDYLGIWSKNLESNFLCIEPWCGIADYEEHNKDFISKKGILKLEPNDDCEKTFFIEIGKNEIQEDKLKYENHEQNSRLEQEINRIKDVLDKKSTKSKEIIEVEKNLKEKVLENKMQIESKEEKENNFNTLITFFSILAAMLFCFAIYLFIKDNSKVQTKIIEKPIEKIVEKVVEKPVEKVIIKEKIVNKVINTDYEGFKNYFNSSKFDAIRCYDFKPNNSSLSTECKTSINNYIALNKEIIKFELIPIVSDEDNKFYEKIVEKNNEINNGEKAKIKDYLLRGISGERMMEAIFYMKEKLGEDVIIIPTNYYVKSKVTNSGFMIKAYIPN